MAALADQFDEPSSFQGFAVRSLRAPRRSGASRTDGVPAEGRVRGVAGDTFRSLLASGGMQLANIVTGVLLARMLGPAGKGVLTAILLWPGLIVAILSLGIYESATYYAAVEKVRGSRIAGGALLIGLVQSGAAVAVWLLILPIVLGHYGADTVTDGRIFALWIPTYLVAVIAMGVLLGRMEISLYNGLRLAQTLLITVVLLLVLVLPSRNVLLVLYVYLGVHLVSMISSDDARSWHL